jgi:hypothetical protein
LEDNKKQGQRDISDLKARLGLKKTGTMQAVNPADFPDQNAPTAVTPPPAPAPRPAAPPPPGIPSPFGAAAQAAPEPEPPAAPPPPADPRLDPFAQQQAANLAAFYGIGQVLPGSTEGVSAEPLEKPKPWSKIGGIGGIALAMFVVGNACGRVYQGRVEYNTTIDQAAQIRTVVEKVQKQVNEINDAIAASAPTKANQPDFALAKKLAELDLTKPDTQKLFQTNYKQLEDVAIEGLFTYYDGSIRLFDLVVQHAKKTDADKDAIENFTKSGGKGDKNYGVILDASGPVTTAKLVEVGPPVCQDKSTTECNAAQLVGFKYRADSGAGWSERPVKGKPTEVVTPINQTPFFKSVASGNPDILAYKDYVRRMVEIRKLVTEVSGQQKPVTDALKKAAERSKLFTF